MLVRVSVGEAPTVSSTMSRLDFAVIVRSWVRTTSRAAGSRELEADLGVDLGAYLSGV